MPETNANIALVNLLTWEADEAQDRLQKLRLRKIVRQKLLIGIGVSFAIHLVLLKITHNSIVTEKSAPTPRKINIELVRETYSRESSNRVKTPVSPIDPPARPEKKHPTEPTTAVLKGNTNNINEQIIEKPISKVRAETNFSTPVISELLFDAEQDNQFDESTIRQEKRFQEIFNPHLRKKLQENSKRVAPVTVESISSTQHSYYSIVEIENGVCFMLQDSNGHGTAANWHRIKCSNSNEEGERILKNLNKINFKD